MATSDRPRLGVNHPTVVPTNLDEDDTPTTQGRDSRKDRARREASD